MFVETGQKVGSLLEKMSREIFSASWWHQLLAKERLTVKKQCVLFSGRNFPSYIFISALPHLASTA